MVGFEQVNVGWDTFLFYIYMYIKKNRVRMAIFLYLIKDQFGSALR